MDFIIDWITQIILFLLLAMVIELILPNSDMKKYINMVVGLLLILIFLQPLFQLFKVDVEDIITSAVPALDTTREEEMMKNSIELKKSEIQASQDAYVLEEMAVQMINQVKEGLSKEYDVAIIDITFQFEGVKQPEMENLEKINVMLGQSKSNQADDGAVEDIVIDLDKNEETEQLTPDTEKIKMYLSEQWQLDNQLITILWEGGV
ncbi:stage III sporulation protein AF [Aquibacillus halophilus]|uniref:Stage III sporulation protein AF n=1 Tax=Aquibacillus halophilus TaxID=930132 RepID=A0A6A8DPH1_9BACI|nr:stage III sporulation protein AF [Aquibacillus halophilus]MRH43162.1 stage III sporulation protein AF [Aquibacillus halophilus]